MDQVTKEVVLAGVAPCSLMCYTCPALKDGPIAQHAAKLCNYFEGYYDFNDANLPEKYRGWLAEFDIFYKRLERFAKRPCVGCRNQPVPGSGCIEGCIVPACVKVHEVDFCGDCPEFPCDAAEAQFERINETILADWRKGSARIREIGAERYFNEKKDVSHYISYKKKADQAST